LIPASEEIRSLKEQFKVAQPDLLLNVGEGRVTGYAERDAARRKWRSISFERSNCSAVEKLVMGMTRHRRALQATDRHLEMNEIFVSANSRIQECQDATKTNSMRRDGATDHIDAEVPSAAVDGDTGAGGILLNERYPASKVYTSDRTSNRLVSADYENLSGGIQHCLSGFGYRSVQHKRETKISTRLANEQTTLDRRAGIY
jgi:hypothetical protein